MDFKQSIRSSIVKNIALLSAVLFTLLLALNPLKIYSQCVTETTGVWSMPSDEFFSADLNGVTVDIQAINPNLSRIDEVVSSTTLTTTDPSWFSEAVAGNPSLEFLMIWDIIEESQLEDIDDINDDKQTGILRFTFSEPVTCVTLHVERIGGAGAVFNSGGVGISNSARWTITTPGITLQKPAGTGTDDFVVTPTEFFKEPDVPNTNANSLATQETTTGAAAGSVKLISSTPISQFEFEWTGTGVEGVGADRLELVVTAQPNCFPVAELDKQIDDVRILPDGSFEVDYGFQIENSGQTSINQMSLIDELASNFGCAFIGLNGSPTVNLINNSGQSSVPTLNGNFNGNNDANIFIGNDGILESGDIIEVKVFTILDSDCPGVESPLRNEVLLTGLDILGQAVQAIDEVDLFLPKLSLSKTADISSFSDPVSPGDPINYSFEVCNTGNGIISNIQINDPLQGILIFSFPFSLSPGECNSTSVTGLYTITSQDLINGQVSNQATARGFSEDGALISDQSDDPNDSTNVDPDLDGDPDDPTVVMLDPVPIITLNKIANTSLIQNPTVVGDQIIYGFEVCNTGSLELNNVIVTDPLVTLTGTAFSLLPGNCNSTSFEGIYTINQQDLNIGLISNTASVSSESSFGDLVTDESSVDVFLNMAPQVELIKSANTNGIQNPTAVGDVIQYSFEVCNTGNVLLDNVIVSDPLIMIPPIPISLEINECDNMSFSGSYAVTAADIESGVIENSASVRASSPSGIIVIDDSDDARGELPGEDDPTTVDLFPCNLDVGELKAIPNECISRFETINLRSNFIQDPTKPNDFDVLFVLTTGEDFKIIDTNTSPSFSVTNPGEYRIHTLIAETSNPQSSNYLNPSIIISGVTEAAEVISFIENHSICAVLDEVGVTSLISDQPVVELINRVTICNSDELLMPTAIVFADLFISDKVVGIWAEENLGTITDESFDFANFTAGEYIFEFTTNSAIDPCVNVSGSTIVTVVDCFSECDELICNEDLQVSLGEDCIFVPSPDQLLESPATGVYTVEYFYENDRPYGIDTLRSNAAGELLTYNISCAGNSCWGKILVETNNIPEIQSPCACNNNELPNDACILWCQDEDQIASVVVSAEEAKKQFGECGPEILGQIDVIEEVSGDICDPMGVKHTLRYTAKIIRHGTIKQIDILCQTYWVQKFNINVSDSEFNSAFGFPGDVILDCDYLDKIRSIDSTLTEGSAESILLSQEQDSLAYPYYINTHVYVQDSVYQIDTQLVLVDSFLVDTLLVNQQGEWEVVTVALKEYDTLYYRELIPNGMAVHPLVSIKDRTCNLLVSSSDVQFETCGSGTKIVRSWTIVDWCDANIEKSGIQTIEIKDVTAPQILKREGDGFVEITSLPDVQIGVDPWACSASFRLPQLDIMDNCDQDLTTVWSTVEGKIIDNFASELWFEFSPVELTAFVFDDCDNVTELTMMVNVIDDVPPVAFVESELLVTLAYGNPGFDQGEAKLYASDIDEGSHDGCTEVSFKAVKAIDWEVEVFNCKGEFVGYRPRTSSATTQFVDLGSENEKNECVFDSTNLISLVIEPQDFVNFDCDDNGLDFDVILFVLDKAGNQNQAVTNVLVRDESVPYLECEDIEFSCTDLEEDDEFEFEEPDILGSACFNFVLQADIASERRIEGACGSAQVIVEWYLDLDQSGDPTFGDAFCTQNVQIETEGEVLKPETIKWPQHYTGESFEGINIECDTLGLIFEVEQEVRMADPLVCVPGLHEAEGPVWCDSDCGVVGTSVEIDTIFSDDACMKIIRKWTVIDWCVFEANENSEPDDRNDRFVAIEDWAKDECADCFEFGPYDSDHVYFRYQEEEQESNGNGSRYQVDFDGYYTFDQIIKVVDNTPPTITAADSIYVSIDISGVDQDTFGVCFGSGIVTASAIDFCGAEELESPLNWSARVLDDQGKLVSDIVSHDSILGAFVRTGLGAPGDTRIVIWTVNDGCGNMDVDTTIALFVDQTPPISLCPSSFTTSLNDIDSVLVFWAQDFNQSSYDNCSAQEDLSFSIVFDGQTPISPAASNFNDNESIILDCGFGGSIVDLNLWVWDQSGNGDFCQISITIESNDEECNTELGLGYFISGQVQTEDRRPIENVQFNISSSLNEYPKVTQSDVSGNYTIINNPEAFNYTIDAYKDDSFINGLSTLDLILLQRHIIAIGMLESPYKILAGDANRDKQLSASDILDFRKIILGLTDGLENLDPWIFIDESASFINTSSPWPFTESITITDLKTDIADAHFVGVKIGDINEDVETTSVSEAETRIHPELELLIHDKLLQAGEQYSLAISAADQLDIFGLQMTLSHEGLEYIGVSSGQLRIHEHNVGDFTTDISISINEHVTIGDLSPLFYIDFKAYRDVRIKDILDINHQVTKSEAYVGDKLEVYKLSERFIEDIDVANVTLEQNIPNPFKDETFIPFSISVESVIEFSFYDVFGRKLFNVKDKWLKGNHQLKMTKEDLQNNGIIFYDMKVGTIRKTGRMTIIE